jgi:phage terminase small subunit
MASGGHNRKPIAQLKAEGTYREDRHGNFAVDEPKEIRQLTREITHEEAFTMFAEYCLEAGCSQEPDHLLIEMFATHFVILQEAKKAIQDKTATEFKGAYGVSPINAYSVSAKEIRILMAEYRLTPASREAAAKETVDALGDFLNNSIN